jgi:ABC-2 type transport system permease protein
MHHALNTIYILWLRQIKRYVRSKSRIIGSLAQPLLFLFALGYGLGPVFSAAQHVDYIQFLVPGIIAMSILFTSMFSGIEIIWDRQFGFLKETLAAPVSRFHIMLGRTLGGATVASMQGLMVFFISMAAGFRPVSWAMVPVAFLVIFLIATLFTALGTAIASRLTDMHGFQLIMNFMVMPMFFLSGAVFPLDTAPAVLRTLSHIDPLTYGVDALRGLLINVSYIGIPFDIFILTLVGIVFITAGAVLFSRLEA